MISTFIVLVWSVGEDLYIIPTTGSCMLMTSHHGELFGLFPTEGALANFEGEMTRLKFPARRHSGGG